MISSRIPYIGRAHLDKAIEEGRSAAADVARSESDCPYRSHDKPMIRHAWLRGFRAIRRNVSIAGVSS
ncbi:ribosome modulation factor [Sphingomonas sp. LR60]|jgi:ribosome modulation factor|uniref:ribosome modulation factor n=1 Tax=Sphingomonas sp. LR60 TaxID=3050233 RepID=UPI003FA7C524